MSDKPTNYTTIRDLDQMREAYQKAKTHYYAMARTRRALIAYYYTQINPKTQRRYTLRDIAKHLKLSYEFIRQTVVKVNRDKGVRKHD